MQITKQGVSWVRDIADHVTETELRTLLREAKDEAEARQTNVVQINDLEIAWTRMNGGGK